MDGLRLRPHLDGDLTTAQCWHVDRRLEEPFRSECAVEWDVLLELLELAVDDFVARQQRQPVVELW